MLNHEIEELQRKLEKGLKQLHPDNEVSYAMTQRYRELEKLKV